MTRTPRRWAAWSTAASRGPAGGAVAGQRFGETAPHIAAFCCSHDPRQRFSPAWLYVERKELRGVVSPPRIDGKDGVAGAIPAGPASELRDELNKATYVNGSGRHRSWSASSSIQRRGMSPPHEHTIACRGGKSQEANIMHWFRTASCARHLCTLSPGSARRQAASAACTGSRVDGRFRGRQVGQRRAQRP